MNRIAIIDRPAPVVTAQEAKDARVFPVGDGDAFITECLKVAQATIDGPEGWFGMSIGIQTLELIADRFYSVIELPFPPAAEIVSIKYDTDAATDVLLEGYRVFSLNAGKDKAYLLPAHGAAWPVTRCAPEAVRIRYKAGYAAAAVPAPIKRAIMLMGAELRTHGIDLGRVRSETVEGVGSKDYQVPVAAEEAMRKAAERLLSTFRVYV